MERVFKRQKISVGAVVKVPINDSVFSYARILEGDIAFYNIFTDQDLPLEEILKKEILFILPVNDYAITKGFWQKISKAIPLEPHLERLALTPMFWQNPIRPNHFRLVYSDKIVEASAKECVGLERWAVWTPESIEQRLRDYYEGKENFYVQRNKEAWALAEDTAELKH